MNDLISRQAAIEAVNHICPVDTEYDCTLLDRVDVRCVLLDLPPAYERKKGRWELAIGYDPKRRVMCTECHRMAYEPTPFCPNCGADMRGEEQDE